MILFKSCHNFNVNDSSPFGEVKLTHLTNVSGLQTIWAWRHQRAKPNSSDPCVYPSTGLGMCGLVPESSWKFISLRLLKEICLSPNKRMRLGFPSHSRRRAQRICLHQDSHFLGINLCPVVLLPALSPPILCYSLGRCAIHREFTLQDQTLHFFPNGNSTACHIGGGGGEKG